MVQHIPISARLWLCSSNKTLARTFPKLFPIGRCEIFRLTRLQHSNVALSRLAEPALMQIQAALLLPHHSMRIYQLHSNCKPLKYYSMVVSRANFTNPNQSYNISLLYDR